ncbi:hypothetical protein DID99_34330 [Burkholderia sp. Bp8986]|nr:hypothetical protein DID99_34330 [Burkholderia sp. Bp8986]
MEGSAATNKRLLVIDPKRLCASDFANMTQLVTQQRGTSLDGLCSQIPTTQADRRLGVFKSLVDSMKAPAAHTQAADVTDQICHLKLDEQAEALAYFRDRVDRMLPQLPPEQQSQLLSVLVRQISKFPAAEQVVGVAHIANWLVSLPLQQQSQLLGMLPRCISNLPDDQHEAMVAWIEERLDLLPPDLQAGPRQTFAHDLMKCEGKAVWALFRLLERQLDTLTPKQQVPLLAKLIDEIHSTGEESATVLARLEGRFDALTPEQSLHLHQSVVESLDNERFRFEVCRPLLAFVDRGLDRLPPERQVEVLEILANRLHHFSDQTDRIAATTCLQKRFDSLPPEQRGQLLDRLVDLIDKVDSAIMLLANRLNNLPLDLQRRVWDAIYKCGPWKVLPKSAGEVKGAVALT